MTVPALDLPDAEIEDGDSRRSPWMGGSGGAWTHPGLPRRPRGLGNKEPRMPNAWEERAPTLWAMHRDPEGL